MSTNSHNEIYSSRELNTTLEIVYQAFANPLQLKNWWGPEGFTNTIHEFDLRPEGKWLLTMHGPEKGNYENSSVFKTVVPNNEENFDRLERELLDILEGKNTEPGNLTK